MIRMRRSANTASLRPKLDRRGARTGDTLSDMIAHAAEMKSLHAEESRTGGGEVNAAEPLSAGDYRESDLVRR